MKHHSVRIHSRSSAPSIHVLLTRLMCGMFPGGVGSAETGNDSLSKGFRRALANGENVHIRPKNAQQRGPTFPEGVRTLVCRKLAGAGSRLWPQLRPWTGCPWDGTWTSFLPRPWRQLLAFRHTETNTQDKSAPAPILLTALLSVWSLLNSHCFVSVPSQCL